MTKNELSQQRSVLLTDASKIVNQAKSNNRDLTAEENDTLTRKTAEVRSLNERLQEMEANDATRHALFGGPGSRRADGPDSAGFLALTGVAAREAAVKIAGQMRGGDPFTKALAPSGTVVTGVPLDSQSPYSLGQVAPNLLAVLPVRQQQGERYSYLRQASRSNLAAAVAQGALKPTSAYGLVHVDATLAVVAHLSEAIPVHWISDNSSLQQFVSNELLAGLNVAVEDQILNGDGIAPNMTGILATSGIQSQSAVGTDIMATTRSAVTKLQTAGHTPSVWVISPTDWERFDLARNESGAFDLREGPVDTAKRLLWSVPVTVSTTIAAGTAALLDTTAIAVNIDTLGVQVKWSESVGEDFERNLIRSRCEGRFGVSVFQGLGIVKVTLPA